ncbi:hypothetical protein BC834DRAFT_700799 [Gloeopeniophorella convolvens]|nr:hypothetical protein BC834DRAFT_423066 [Gloeopeniophorella convolvens]KAI0258643.1 hypothetical protein BC834DRAFT_700799 [Gloeopeniophorella convolvens]
MQTWWQGRPTAYVPFIHRRGSDMLQQAVTHSSHRWSTTGRNASRYTSCQCLLRVLWSHQSGCRRRRRTLQHAAGSSDSSPRRVPQDVAAAPCNTVIQAACRTWDAADSLQVAGCADSDLRRTPQPAATDGVLCGALPIKARCDAHWWRLAARSIAGGTSCEGSRRLAGHATRWRRRHALRRECHAAGQQRRAPQRTSGDGLQNVEAQGIVWGLTWTACIVARMKAREKVVSKVGSSESTHLKIILPPHHLYERVPDTVK